MLPLFSFQQLILTTDYPTIGVDVGTRIVPDSGIIPDKAEDGTTRTRSMYASTQYDIEVHHMKASMTDRNAVAVHFSLNKTATFNFLTTYGVTYQCRYANEPEEQMLAGFQFNIISKLKGVRV